MATPIIHRKGDWKDQNPETSAFPSSLTKRKGTNSAQQLSTNKKIHKTQEKSSSKLSTYLQKQLNMNSTTIEDSKQNGFDFTEYKQNPKFLNEQSTNKKIKSKYNLSNNFEKINKNKGKKVVHQEYSNPLLILPLKDRILKDINCIKHKPFFRQDNENLFKPNINSSLPFSIYPQKHLSPQLSLSKQERFERLIQDLRQKQLQRFEQKVSKQKQIEKESCTFLPNKQKIILRDRVDPFIHTKLFNQAKSIQQKVKANQIELIVKEKQKIKQYNQQSQKRYEQRKKNWSLYLNSQKHQQIWQKPLYQRTEETVSLKRQLLDNLTQKYYGSQPIKQYMGQQQSDNLLKRLVSDYLQNKSVQRDEAQQKAFKEFKKQHPFNPTLISYNPLFSKQNKLTRQQSSISNSIDENLTFQPRINDASKLIANYLKNKHSGQYPQSWSKNQRFIERLYEGNQIAKLDHLQRIQSEIYNQCTFMPEINELSKDLMYTYNSEPTEIIRHKCQLPDSIIMAQRQLTFQPQINLQSKWMSANKKQNTILKNKQKSKEKLSKIQYEKQYKELQQCTFYPQTISTSLEWKKWKVSNLKKSKMVEGKKFVQQSFVRGLDTFLSHCKKGSLKKQEDRKRYDEVFNFQKKYDERRKKLVSNIKPN